MGQWIPAYSGMAGMGQCGSEALLPIDRCDGIKSAAKHAAVRRDLMCVSRRQWRLDEADLRDSAVSRLAGLLGPIEEKVQGGF